jgi:hypothetical protein
MPKRNDDSISTDLLHGAREISRYLGIPERRVFYYVAKKQLPVTRLGSLIIGSKKVLRRHFAPEKGEVA